MQLPNVTAHFKRTPTTRPIANSTLKTISKDAPLIPDPVWISYTTRAQMIIRIRHAYSPAGVVSCGQCMGLPWETALNNSPRVAFRRLATPDKAFKAFRPPLRRFRGFLFTGRPLFCNFRRVYCSPRDFSVFKSALIRRFVCVYLTVFVLNVLRMVLGFITILLRYYNKNSFKIFKCFIVFGKCSI